MKTSPTSSQFGSTPALSTITIAASKANPALAVEYRPIHDLHPDPKNPRQHSKHQIRQIARSMETFGNVVPVLVSGNDAVVAGHGRILACQLLGWTTVPTIKLEHLTPEQATAFRIADNKLTMNATWDDALLAEQLRDLSMLDLSFSLDVTGFEMGEIDLRILSLDAKNDDDDLADKPPSLGIPVCRPGDLWALGRHRALCGSSLEEESYRALMDGKKAQMVFQDSPFNVKISGHVCGNGAVKHREFAMASGEMTAAEYTRFLTTVFSLAAAFSGDGSIHFQCIDWRHLPEILAAGKSAYTELKNVCIWDKGHGGLGSMWRSQHELVLVFKNGTGPHVNNVELGKHGRYRTNVWAYPGINSFARQTEEGNLLALHPTVKPVALVADAILDCSKRRHIVLDPFLGSGTTVLAAERTGRIGYGIELDPLYVDVAIRRWQTLTGESAVLLRTGEHFSAIEARQAAAGASAKNTDTAARVPPIQDIDDQKEVEYGYN